MWRGRDDIAAEVGRALKKGAVVGLLIDQDTRTRGCFVPFFGRLAWTPRGAAELLRQSDSPVVVGFIRRRPGGGHEIHAESPALRHGGEPEQDDVQNTAILTRAIEEAVRARPEEWVWMHERWRTRPDRAARKIDAVPDNDDVTG